MPALQSKRETSRWRDASWRIFQCLTVDQQIEDALAELKSGHHAGSGYHQTAEYQRVCSSIEDGPSPSCKARDTSSGLPDEPKNDEEKEIKARYDKIKGGAVNPVLREGNSDRRAPKERSRNMRRITPHSMGAPGPATRRPSSPRWAKTTSSRTKIGHCSRGDKCKNRARRPDGNVTVLKEKISLKAGEVLDATVMKKRRLSTFSKHKLPKTKETRACSSRCMKATMMKVSDPIIFGHAVKVFFKDLLGQAFGDNRRARSGLQKWLWRSGHQDPDPSAREESGDRSRYSKRLSPAARSPW